MRGKWCVALAFALAAVIALPILAAGPVTVKQEGGSPWIRFAEGQDRNVRAEGASGGTGGLVALAAADFDGDGVKDLACASETGALTLWKGNPDALHPNSDAARQHKADGTYTDEPFVATAVSYNLPITPDFLGGGDFNGDGFQDVVAAANKDKTLYLVPGDGRGGFGPYQAIGLPGKLTTLVTGEVNRADGLVDVMVGVKKGGKGSLLVFEGPSGALKQVTPEAFSTNRPITTAAVGLLPGSSHQNIVAASGNKLYVIWGRDRKLSLDERARGTVTDAVVETRKFSKAIQSVAIGHFNGDRAPMAIAVLLKNGTVEIVSPSGPPSTWAGKRPPLEAWSSKVLGSDSYSGATQMLTGRVSSRAGDDLVLMDGAGSRIVVQEGNKKAVPGQALVYDTAPMAASLRVTGEPVAVLPMRLSPAAMQGLVILRRGANAPTTERLTPGTVYMVNVDTDDNAGGGGEGTGTVGDLRYCMEQANANPGLDTINFEIPSPPNIYINAQNYWPDITDAVVLDGTSQPGYYYGGGLGGAITIGPVGFYVEAGNSTVMGFEIWCGEGGYLQYGSIKARPPGSRFATPEGLVSRAGRAEQDPLQDAIILTENGGNVVQSIFTTAMFNWEYYPNTFIAVEIDDVPDNLIGGTYVADRNVLSNSYGGVDIFGEYATGNLVQGNWIGPNVTGKNAIGNYMFDVYVGAPNNTVGGTEPGAGNVIAGEWVYGQGDFGAGEEVYPYDGDIGVWLESWNYEEVAHAGVKSRWADMSARKAEATARRQQAKENRTRPYVKNTQRQEQGVYGGILVQQNIIGLDPSGTQSMGYYYGYFRKYVGVYADDEYDTVGGTVPTAKNLMSNNFIGVNFDDSWQCLIQGNWIGTDITGGWIDYPVGNFFAGVFFDDETEGCTVGGTAAGARNVVAGTGYGIGVSNATPEDSYFGVGVFIYESGANTVQGNLIGTDVTGLSALPNWVGVAMEFSGSNLIGGTDPGAGNVISGNFMYGIAGEYTGSDFIQGNLIGTDVTGLVALPNFFGIYLAETSEEQIGGTDPGAPNVISGNSVDGISVNGSYGQPVLRRTEQSGGNIIEGNFIGTDAANTLLLGNGYNGVYINGSPGNVVGGSNVIAHNGENGVMINGGFIDVGGAVPEASPADSNLITQNSIFDNASLGIDLVNGANNNQQAPSLASATSTVAGTTVTGSVSGFLADTEFTLEFFDNEVCDGSGFGEGQTYLGSLGVTTDGSGAATFTFMTAVIVPEGHYITATATDPNNNTSEFSECQYVIGCPIITLSPATLPNGATSVAYSAAFTATGGLAPYTYSLAAGDPPPGLTLHPDGTLDGTPTLAGTYTFTIMATDDDGCPGSWNYTLTILGAGVFNYNFYGDNGANQLCIDSVNKVYLWAVLTGPGSPAVYTGPAVVANSGSYMWSAPGDPNFMYAVYDPVLHKAYAYFYPAGGGFFYLNDTNTLNNPPCP